MVIKELLRNATDKLKEAGVDEADLKTRLIISHITGKPKEWIITHIDQEIDMCLTISILDEIQELTKGIPIEYITNKKEFMKLNFYVDENVLIPRADTEILVEEVIKRCNQCKILDLCTGSGAIAVSLAKYMTNSKVYASDVSKEALKIAKKNAEYNKVDVTFIQSDMFENISENDFDIIVSNPPYIEAGVIKTLQKEVQYEPHIALDGGQDGLDFYRIIAREAKSYIKKGGLLALEIGYNQAEAVAELLNNYKNIEVLKDLAGNNRVVICEI